MIIKLMPEYGCSPIWISEKDGMFGNADIHNNNLSISEELKNEIEKWSKKFEKTYDENYPPDSKFLSEIDAIEFEKDGILIWENLQKQLNYVIKVYYFSILRNKLYNSIENYNLE